MHPLYLALASPLCLSQQELSFVKKKKTGLLFFNDTDTVAVGQKNRLGRRARLLPVPADQQGERWTAAGCGARWPTGPGRFRGKDLAQVDVATQQPRYR
jgi:hypothetical protein